MASPLRFYLSFRKVLVLYLIFTFISSLLVCALSESQSQSRGILGRRRLLLKFEEAEQEENDLPNKKKIQAKIKTSSSSTKTQLKKLNSTSKSTPKASENLSTKTQLKKLNSTSKSTPKASENLSTKTRLKKLNSTSKPTDSAKTQLKKLKPPTSKSSNYTKPTSLLVKKTTLDLTKPTTPKNKTTKPIPSKQPQATPKSKNPEKIPQTQDKKPKTQNPKRPDWINVDDDFDFVGEFKDLPYRFQQTLIPDLEKFSKTSSNYLKIANKEITKGFKPLVGNRYAQTIASVVSLTFLLIPLLLVSLLVTRIKAYFSLQKLLIFAQAYLAIYFGILALSALATGLEPMKFFYATARPTYACVQALQAMGYLLYLLLLLMYLVLVFSAAAADSGGLGSRAVALAQTIVGFSVGLHYYVAVFHRAVLGQPPQTNWRVHGIYATCFLGICLLAQADRRKKAYVEEGGEEGKKN